MIACWKRRTPTIPRSDQSSYERVSTAMRPLPAVQPLACCSTTVARCVLMGFCMCCVFLVGHAADRQLAASYGGCSVSWSCPPLLYTPLPTAQCAVPLAELQGLLAEVRALALREAPPIAQSIPALQKYGENEQRARIAWRINTAGLKMNQKSRLISCVTRTCSSLVPQLAVKWDDVVPVMPPSPGSALRHGVIHPAVDSVELTHVDSESPPKFGSLPDSNALTHWKTCDTLVLISHSDIELLRAVVNANSLTARADMPPEPRSRDRHTPYVIAALEWCGQNGEDVEAALLAWELANSCRQQMRASRDDPPRLVQLLPATLPPRCKEVIIHALTDYMQNESEAHDTVFLIEAQHLLYHEWERPAMLHPTAAPERVHVTEETQPSCAIPPAPQSEAVLLCKAVEDRHVYVASVDVPLFKGDKQVYAESVRNRAKHIATAGAQALGVDEVHQKLCGAAAASLELLLFSGTPLSALPEAGVPFRVQGIDMHITRLFSPSELDVEIAQDGVSPGAVAQSAMELNGEGADDTEMRIRPVTHQERRMRYMSELPALASSTRQLQHSSTPSEGPTSAVVLRGSFDQRVCSVLQPQATYAAVPVTHLHRLRDTLKAALLSSTVQCYGYISSSRAETYRCLNRRFVDPSAAAVSDVVVWCSVHTHQQHEHQHSVALGIPAMTSNSQPPSHVQVRLSYTSPPGVTWWKVPAPPRIEVYSEYSAHRASTP